MKRQRSILIGALLLGLMFSFSVSAKQLKLVASAWPPYVDENLPAKGLAMDLVSTALTRAGYTPSITIETWPRALEGTEIGIYDVIAGAWYSDERARHFAFSEPFYMNEIKFIKRKERGIVFNNLKDLDNLRIGIVEEYAYGDEFARATNFIKVTRNHVIQNLLTLTAGQIDLTLDDALVIRHELQQYMPSQIKDLEFLPKPLDRKGLHVAITRKHPDHKKIAMEFDKAIAQMKADGTYKKIIKKHGF